ncbi:DUF6774 domain-containing protein [Aminipila sp.]|uniref:DUF6774 domain-containing protein n=1 Tax=Aminipila sp. TaxID=2060095 RepID=UPI00289C5D08|nr:DUF6774 domain-containing protein [Aminipila sp.]
MNSCELVSAITALAIIIANQTPNDDELSLLASSLNQLGDTLATIAAQRELQESQSASLKKPTSTE